MKWTKEKIAEWSVKTFPSLSAEQQMEKLEIELNELMKALTPADKLEEKADVYIVLAILEVRFGCGWAGFAFACLLYGNGDEYAQQIQEAVDIKMDINAKRTWALINGEYRHVD